MPIHPVLLIVVVILAWVLVRVSLQLISRRKGRVQVSYSEAAQEKEKARLEQEKARRKASTALQLFIAQCGRLAQKLKMTVLMPGSIALGDETTRLTLLLVGKGGVLGVKSFSFGGEVQGHVAASWTRTENGETHTFASPVAGCEADTALLRRLLDENGLGDVPVRCVPVFVNTAAQLHIPAAVEYYTAKSFYAALEEGALLPETNCDPAALMALLQKNLKQG